MEGEIYNPNPENKSNWHARKRNWQTNKTREKIRDSIKTGQIVKTFENHVLKSEGEEGYVKLTMTQITAGKVLLDRTLPVLSSSEIVENFKDPGITDTLERLKALVGPDLAQRLIQGKARLSETERVVVEVTGEDDGCKVRHGVPKDMVIG